MLKIQCEICENWTELKKLNKKLDGDLLCCDSCLESSKEKEIMV